MGNIRLVRSFFSGDDDDILLSPSLPCPLFRQFFCVYSCVSSSHLPKILKTGPIAEKINSNRLFNPDDVFSQKGPLPSRKQSSASFVVPRLHFYKFAPDRQRQWKIFFGTQWRRSFFLSLAFRKKFRWFNRNDALVFGFWATNLL